MPKRGDYPVLDKSLPKEAHLLTSPSTDCAAASFLALPIDFPNALLSLTIAHLAELLYSFHQPAGFPTLCRDVSDLSGVYNDNIAH